ncbi:MAG: hypothetical protein PHV08_00735 [Sulfurovaceae bacterium]|jgi:phage FluMu protein Com|nr:hypothetical protein [Sulfurovaceae bacterium]
MESIVRKIIYIIAIVILTQNFIALFFGVNFIKGQGFKDANFSLWEIIFASVLLLTAQLIKPKTPQFTKCPQCKETFSYKDTINGKCPNCKDVDTLDIKEYYNKFSEEKK